jgi:hypothetical protein
MGFILFRVVQPSSQSMLEHITGKKKIQNAKIPVVVEGDGRENR